MSRFSKMRRLGGNSHLGSYGVIWGVTLVLSAAAFLTQDRLKWADLTQLPASELGVQTKPIDTVSLAEALQLYRKGTGIFIDVREKRYYDYGHIAGARTIPTSLISSVKPLEIASLQQATAAIVYCNGLSCGEGMFAARYFADKGLTNVKLYLQGWPEWRLCQLPIDKSREMLEDERAPNYEP